MADFSVQATGLSAPQAAGSAPVAPTDVMRPIDGGKGQFIGTVSDLLVRGLKTYQADAAEQRKQGVVQGYIQREVAINQAIASGQMTPQEAAARSRANFNQYAAGYGEYIQEFEKAGKALRGFTESGEVESQLKAEREIRDRDIKQAQERGFVFVPGMSQTTQDEQIAASKRGIISERELSAFYKKQEELRASGRYNAEVEAREFKQLSSKLVNSIAADNLTAFQSFTKTLGDNVRTGGMSQQEALATLSSRFANISASIQAAANANPELAAPYRSLFEGMFEVGKKLIDQKENAEVLANQLKVLETKMKLVAMQDPQIAATVVANQLLPNNPSLALSSAPQGVRAITLLSDNAVETNNFAIPHVPGNPELEGPTLDLLKEGIKSLNQGKVQNKEMATIQASNSVNNLLKQTGRMLDMGATPKQLTGVAKFFASPEYATFVANNKLNPEAAQAAKKTFQLLYEPTIVRGVQKTMDEALFTSKTEDGKPMKIGDAVDVKFTGSGVVFEAKNIPSLSPAEKRQQRVAIESMKAAQTAINQVIHIGAHMEGTTDYAKHWEDNKHVYMPDVFPDPVQLKPGATVDGYQYLGGNYRDPANWKPVGQPTK